MQHVSPTWSIAGAEGLPIYGNTHTPGDDAAAPVRGVAIVVHGWLGNKDRNIVPVMAEHLASIGLVAHRVTLSHAGVGRDGDRIVETGAFFNDSLAHCVQDIRAVMEHIRSEPGRVGPVAHTAPILIGHSRAGATIIRVAALAERERWPVKPRALISLAGTAVYTRFTEAMRAELAAKGYLEAPSPRGSEAWARGGMPMVRMGPTWYAHHLDSMGDPGHAQRDLFAEDAASIACPLMIVHGDADATVPLANAHRVLELVSANPRASVRLAIIPGGDHNFGVSGYSDAITGRGSPALRAAHDAVTGFVEGGEC